MMKRPVPQAKHISNPEWKGPEGKPTTSPLHSFYQPAIAAIKPYVGSSRSFSQDKHAKGLGPGAAIKW